MVEIYRRTGAATQHITDARHSVRVTTMRLPLPSISRRQFSAQSITNALLFTSSLLCFDHPLIARATASSARNTSAAFAVSSLGKARPLAHYRTLSKMALQMDEAYPGTAVERMQTARTRVRSLTVEQLHQDWDEVRRILLWAGGLRDLSDARPGEGYTGHAFNDFNHVDLTCMLDDVAMNENQGQVPGIARGNKLGPGIRIASLEDLGPGGSWSTCHTGCNKEPPQDVAHVQFQSRIAFKLVWVPNDNFDTFVLIDDDGALLNSGTPSGALPPLRERQLNYRVVQGSKYAREADRLGRHVVTAAAE